VIVRTGRTPEPVTFTTIVHTSVELSAAYVVNVYRGVCVGKTATVPAAEVRTPPSGSMMMARGVCPPPP